MIPKNFHPKAPLPYNHTTELRVPPRTRSLQDHSTVTHGLGRAAPGVRGSARRGRRGLRTPSAQVLSYFRAAHSPLRLWVPHTGGTLPEPARFASPLCFEGGLPKHENTKHRPVVPAQNTKTQNTGPCGPPKTRKHGNSKLRAC